MPSLSIDHEKSVEILLILLVEKLEKGEFELPPLPQVASQVLALTSDPHANASKLAVLIEQDPILAAKLFQTSNSMVQGSTRQIDSLQQAIAWLGLNTVAGTAFTLSVQSGVFKIQGYEREVKALWRHMLTTAFYAKSIAGLIGRSPDTAFLSGLLHEIGKPLVVHMVNQFQKDSTSPLPWAAIMTLMKESYVEVGRQLADAWGFPDSVKEAIKLHQDHAYHLANSLTKSAAITCLANHFASHCLDPETLSEQTLRALPVVQVLNVPDDVMDALLEIQNDIQVQVESMLT
jgi:putative nucleotidyltransferase with HDIG domain